ncbi:MAG: hypothetical protein P1V51_18045 [Deltaproteobacteria bacterium]|nr:hypothetical protein [Deltaproteobacteria bacterium]
MQCPECGSEQPDGTAICDACDAIIDPSFLGEDAPEFDDEGTDPGLAAAPRGEPGTQIFDAGDSLGRDEGTENFDSGEAGTYVGGAPAGPPGRGDEVDEPPTAARATVPEVPEDDGEYEYEDEYEEEEEPWVPPAAKPAREEFDYRKYVSEEPAPAPEPAAAAPQAGRSRGGAIGRARGGSPSPAVSPGTDPGGSGGVRGALEFDTSSQMMDDYEAMARKLWESFMGLPATEKVSIIGASLAALTVLFPWRIDVSPAGVADETIGLVGMGWVGLLLAVAALGINWYRLTQPGAADKARTLALAVVGTCGAGLLWSVISLGAAASGGEVMVGNPHGVTPGPGYGLFMHLVAWTVAGIGAVVSLKDLPTSRRRRH